MISRITAPYGFVPLSSTVVFPDWLRLRESLPPPLHDVPFQEGLWGTMELEITAETPIFIRGTGPDTSQPFQLDSKTYGIPGTALRGALRNVVEIATFGRFQRVNDHRYAVRDLHNRELYGRHMAEIVRNQKTGKGEPMPLVNAGWLTREKNGKQGHRYRIEVCDFARIEYRPLEELARTRGIKNFRPGEKQSSVNKYNKWGNASLDVEVNADLRRPDLIAGRTMLSRFGLATPHADGTRGTIVFTGQPSLWKPDPTGKRRRAGNAKHHDFVFLSGGAHRSLEVQDGTFRDFEFAHSDRGQQNRLGSSQTPNEEWGYWQERLNGGARVPVFFLTRDDGQLRAMGLAMMFRLSYDRSIGDAIDHVTPDHRRPEAGLDFAEGLFGTVRDSKSSESGGESPRDRSALALKGRIGLSHAVATESTQPVAAAVKVVLGSPKASYYPNYVQQARGGGYRTWMDPDATPRGWKRYRTMTRTWTPPLPTSGDGRSVNIEKVGTTFRPLPEGTRFVAHIDVHNLLPQELGALLWALDFGGDDRARHALGMARPLGYGRCRFSVNSHDVRRMDGSQAELDECRRLFETYMEEQVPGWRSSPQIQELLALTHPVDPDQAHYQRLDPGQRINEFVDAKKAGLSLPSVSAAATSIWPAARESQRFSTSAPHRGGGAPRSASISAGGGSAGWPGKRRDDVIEVELTGLTKKKRWRCTVVGHAGTVGFITEGEAPPEPKEGQKHKTVVISGNNPTGLVLRWKP